MPRPTKQTPERGNARTRLLEAARDTIRRKGFAATSVEDLCQTAGVTKGAYFHHFKSKEALGVAAADYWSEITTPLFAGAAYHLPADPAARVLDYIAFRKALIDGDPAEFSCLAGMMTQEVFDTHPEIRDACARSILGHAETLEADIAAAIAAHGLARETTPRSLALHIQAVIQGAFILAKATGDATLARDSLDHLHAYVTLIFRGPEQDQTPTGENP